MRQVEGANIGTVSPEASVHYELTEEIHFSNRIQVADAIAEQIWPEQQLVSNRMQWNFTFQAFLTGIYVYAGSNLDGLEKTLVQALFSVVGLSVSLFCLFGVMAAQNQSTRLKKHWTNEFCKSPPNDPGDCNIMQGAFPQPFSRKNGSNLGRFASRGVCGALMVMWGFMLLITLGVSFFSLNSKPSANVACTVESLEDKSSTIMMSCKMK